VLEFVVAGNIVLDKHIVAVAIYLDFSGILRPHVVGHLQRNPMSVYNSRNTRTPVTDRASLLSHRDYC